MEIFYMINQKMRIFKTNLKRFSIGCLAITNAIHGTSKDRLYDELGLYRGDRKVN